MQFTKLTTTTLVFIIICFAVAFGPRAFSLVSSKLAQNSFEINPATGIPTTKRSKNAIASVEGDLVIALAGKGLEYGAPMFIRIFKDPGVLEVWLESSNGDFVRFKNYDICTFSGNLGPKLKEGDKQSPEGFYFVRADNLNPASRFHLSFNLGFPNAYDRHHGRTGSALMVHGNCVSIGCYAMTDPLIEEIYALMQKALEMGQPFIRVHAFPFRLTEQALAKHSSNQWHSFWNNLKTGYELFETNKIPPNTTVVDGRYVFDY